MTTTLPLFDLFLELRQPLGLQPQQYQALLKAMEKGFGCTGVDDLKQTCRLLWVSSNEASQLQVFESGFQEFIQRHQTPLLSSSLEVETKDLNKSGDSSTQGSQSTGSVSSTDDRPTKVFSQNKPSATPPHPKPVPSPKQPPTKITTAFQQNTPLGLIERQGDFIIKASDFPFEERLTRHSWRKLNRPLRCGTSSEIDASATAKQVLRQGNLAPPVQLQRRVNQMDLVFLEDREGSMVPFRPIVDELFNTIEPGRFRHIYRYYFRNCPGDFVYCQPKGTDILHLENLPLRGIQTALFIISDAGAMRGGYNPERLDMTKKFIERIRMRVKGIAWINPLPAERWQGTTAAYIEQQVLEGSMFELPTDRVQQAVRAIQG